MSFNCFDNFVSFRAFRSFRPFGRFASRHFIVSGFVEHAAAKQIIYLRRQMNLQVLREDDLLKLTDFRFDRSATRVTLDLATFINNHVLQLKNSYRK